VVIDDYFGLARSKNHRALKNQLLYLIVLTFGFVIPSGIAWTLSDL